MQHLKAEPYRKLALKNTQSKVEGNALSQTWTGSFLLFLVSQHPRTVTGKGEIVVRPSSIIREQAKKCNYVTGVVNP